MVKDAVTGEMFGNRPENLKTSIIESTTPLTLQTLNDLKNDKASAILGLMTLEQGGLSISTYKWEDNWEKKKTQEMTQFKGQVGTEQFKKANNDFNRAYSVWLEEVTQTSEYKKLSDDSQKSLRAGAKDAIKDKVLKEYGFEKPTKETPTQAEKDEKSARDDLLPE